MARNARVDVGGMLYHVINRAVGRMRIFSSGRDYKLFIEVLLVKTVPVPVSAGHIRSVHRSNAGISLAR